jgi:glucosamine--fructose-6-phosphate aminotransferase (isomerizing)
MDRCVIVGRGYEYATAREWALKLKELAQVFADPYSAADFLHGPIALVQPGIPALVRRPTGAPAEGQLELLRRPPRPRRRHRRGRPSRPRRVRLGRWSIALPDGVPEWLRPIVSISPAAALRVPPDARVAGLDPDAPRYIAKVTRTTDRARIQTMASDGARAGSRPALVRATATPKTMSHRRSVH